MKLRRQTRSALNFHQVVNTNERILRSWNKEAYVKVKKIEYFSRGNIYRLSSKENVQIEKKKIQNSKVLKSNNLQMEKDWAKQETEEDVVS